MHQQSNTGSNQSYQRFMPSFASNYSSLLHYLPYPAPWHFNFHNSMPLYPYYPTNFSTPRYNAPPKTEVIAQNQSNIAGQAAPQIEVKEQNGVKGEPISEDAMLIRQPSKPSQSQQKWRQKYGRNIMSNIFHTALKKLSSHQFVRHITKAIRVNHLIIKQTQFQSRLEEKSKFTGSYINSKVIKKLLVGNPIGATKTDIDFRKLLRILLRLYLHNYHITHVYHSGKIKKQSRGLHMQALRKLSKRISKL